MLKKIVVLILFLTLLLCGAWGVWIAPQYTVPILTYHSFSPVVTRGDLLSVSSDHFEQQMAYLKNNGYHVISLDELADGIVAGRDFPHNTVVITIDDGYQNNYQYAYPILKKYGFPATIFLITNFMDASVDFLTWAEVKEMAGHGISFGSHTKNHVYLPSVSNAALLQEEVVGSKEMLERQLGHRVTHFCYPLGGFSEESKAVIEKAGYRSACVTNRGYSPGNKSDLYELHRISVRDKDLALRFANKLTGYHAIFKKCRSGS